MSRGLAFTLRGAALAASAATVVAAAPTAGALLGNPSLGWLATSLMEGLMLSTWYWVGAVDHREPSNQPPALVAAMVALGIAVVSTAAIHGAPMVDMPKRAGNPVKEALVEELRSTSKTRNPEEYARLLTLIEQQPKEDPAPQEAAGPALSWAVASAFPALSVLFMILASFVSRLDTPPPRMVASLDTPPPRMVANMDGYREDLWSGKIPPAPNRMVTATMLKSLYGLDQDGALVIMDELERTGDLTSSGTGHLKRYYRAKVRPEGK